MVVHIIPVVWSWVVMEKRNRRIPVDINCWLEGREGMFCVSTFDLSDTGVCLICTDTVSEGEVMTMKFFTPFSVEPVIVRGEVVWSRTGPEARMGLRFIGMNEAAKGILKSTALLLRTREQMEKNTGFPP
jgi:hypothetical protein